MKINSASVLSIFLFFTIPGSHAADLPSPTSKVRLDKHCLVANNNPFLGLGVSYFTALWRCKFDRPRLERDLAFLSSQGFNYYRMLSMVGYHPAWDGREIPPIPSQRRDGKALDPWPDYWQQLRDLIDIAFDKYQLRTQITIFADAQLMPHKNARLDHMQKILDLVLPGREHKIILLEVANEAWQNGFPGDEGVAQLREFTTWLADRTTIPIATTSNHDYPELGSFKGFEQIYANSSADIATWHFSRDRHTDDGWKPVYDCWDLALKPGFPPVSSNEPIGPGSSVNAERDPLKLVMAAAFAYTAKLPMYVFHCEAGVFGKTTFEQTPAIDQFKNILRLLPPDLPNWQRNDGLEPSAPFTLVSGALRNVGSRKGNQFLCLPIGIKPEGLTLQARHALSFTAYHPLTGGKVMSASLQPGQKITLPNSPPALIIIGH